MGSNTSQLCCIEQLRKRKGGLFAGRGHAGVSLYNPINAGTGSTGVHRANKSTKWPQAVPAAKVHGGICGGKEVIAF